MNIKQFLLRAYFSVRTWWPLWFYILNRKGRKLFTGNSPKLDAHQQRILSDLERDGIATSSLDELFPGKNILSAMRAYATERESSAQPQTKKLFLDHFWDPAAPLDPHNPFLTFAISNKILDVANSYMRMWTRLRYMTLARTKITDSNEPIQSQRWHRDPEEKRMCKVFIYLTDVDDSSGPFIYITQSVYGKTWGRFFPQIPPQGSYPANGAIEQTIPAQAIRTFTGKAGTVIFCDTTGIHRGGFATEKERIMFTAFYSADTYSEQTRYTLPVDFQMKKLVPEAQYAVQK